MKKFRIITKFGNYKKPLYVVQSSYFYFFWKDEKRDESLDCSQRYMSMLIEQRDFKSKVIISE